MVDQPKYEPRLKTVYREQIRTAMKTEFNYSNEMQIPKIEKIVLNMGIGEAVADSKKATAAMKDLAAIAGQKPAATTDYSAIKPDTTVPTSMTVTKPTMISNVSSSPAE